MKTLLLIIFTLASLLNAGIEFTGQKVVLTSEEIKTAGIIRIADLIFLLNDLRFSTIDGYNWQLSINGLASMQQQNWILMIDDRQIHSSFSGTKEINMLPVSVEEIDSVIILTTPHIYNGHFTENGLIQIITEKNISGFSLGGSFYAGNETGDPGPYKYTDLYSPNVDRIGKGGAINGSFSANNFFVRGNFILEEHILTDFAMRRRIHSVSTDGWGSFDRYAPSVEFGFNTAWTRHKFYANYSRAPHYFTFFKQLGREIPTDYSILQSGYSGCYQLTPNRELTVDMHFTSNRTEKSNNIYNLDFDVDLQKMDSKIEYHITGNKYEWRVGSTFEQTRFQTGYILNDNTINLGAVYNTFLYQPNPSASYDFSLTNIFSKNDFATKAAMSGQRAIQQNHVIWVSLSLSRRLFEEENSLWYWIKNGYKLLDDQWLNYSFASDFKNSTHLTFDVSWLWKLRSDFTLNTSAYYRKFSHILLEKQRFIYFPYYCAVRASTDIFPDINGQTGGISLSVKHQPGRLFRQQFSYHYQYVISGNRLFQNAWDAVPSHKAMYRLMLMPVKNLSFWFMVTCMSKAHWHDYDSMNGATCNRYSPIEVKYHSTVRQIINLDVQIKKWFWQRQITASLVGRNLLNKKVSYHPIGASYDLSFYINLAYHLNF